MSPRVMLTRIVTAVSTLTSKLLRMPYVIELADADAQDVADAEDVADAQDVADAEDEEDPAKNE